MSSGGLDILLVEDHAVLARHLARSLPRYQDWRVNVSLSAEEALDWLRERSLDAAIVDLGLPGMSGYELCVHLRSFFKGPILILSAEHREVLRQRALACGADGYLVKPVDVATVARSLQALLALATRCAHGQDAAPSGPASATSERLQLGVLALDRPTGILLAGGGECPAHALRGRAPRSLRPGPLQARAPG